MVDYALDIAKEMSVENAYFIMLLDNYRAVSLTKKMGIKLEYSDGGTVKGVLDLREEGLYATCLKLENLQEISETEKQVPLSGKNEGAKPKTKAAVPT